MEMGVFDREPSSYDNWYKTTLGKHVDEVETRCAFNLLQPQNGLKILDVGCGTGNFSIKLARMGCIVTGVDISDGMLQIARNKASAENLTAKFLTMDICSLEIEDESFDAVISMAALEFIEKPLKAIDEMFRVLKPGGHLLAGTINRDSSWGKLYIKQGQKNRSVFANANFWTMKELSELRPKEIVSSAECLFVPPDIEGTTIGEEKEQEFASKGKGGFICILWKKQ